MILQQLRKGAATLVALLLIISVIPLSTVAASEVTVSASLSCYVTAMGGVEFGAPLLTSTTVTSDSSGEYLTLHLTKGSVTIYSVTCDTFVDASPSYVTEDRGITSGTIGIYTADGTLQTDGVSYTVSDDTALNTQSEAVHYVDSITFPIDSRRETYNLTLFVNSNVMGVQFCNENSAATTATYPATLTVDWSTLSSSGSTVSTSSAVTSSVSESSDTASAEELGGLTVYNADTSSESGAVVQRVSLNTTALVIILIIAGVLVVAGVALYGMAKKQEHDERRAGTEENDEEN